MIHAQDWLVIVGVFLALLAIYWVCEKVLPDSVYVPREFREPPMPTKPIWMSPEHYERKALDQSNFAASHAGTVVSIHTKALDRSTFAASHDGTVIDIASKRKVG